MADLDDSAVEKFYEKTWKQMKESADTIMRNQFGETRQTIHEVGMSAPGFFKNLLKKIANPFYSKEYTYNANGSFRFEVPADDYGNSLKSRFINEFGTYEVCSFPLYGAHTYEDDTFITTIVYINGRPLTTEKFTVVRQYTIDIVIIPEKFLNDKDNVMIEQRRHWNKPRAHLVDDTKFDENYEYVFDGSELGTCFATDNGFKLPTKSTFCPSYSKGESFINKGDYILFFRAKNGEVSERNFNSSISWKKVPRDLYTITKDIQGGSTRNLRLTFNKDGVKSMTFQDWYKIFGSLKKSVTNEKFFGYLYPEFETFIKENEFLIENNSAQWEINIGNDEIPYEDSYSAVAIQSKLYISVLNTEGLVCYYPFCINEDDYSTNNNNVTIVNDVIFGQVRTRNGEFSAIKAATFNYDYTSTYNKVTDSRLAKDYIMITNKLQHNSSDFIIKDNFTVSVFFNSFDEERESGVARIPILAKSPDNPSPTVPFNLVLEHDITNNEYRLCVNRINGNTNSIPLSVEKYPESNKWYNIVITIEKKNDDNSLLEVKAYINGEIVGNDEVTNILEEDYDEDYTKEMEDNFPLIIGKDPINASATSGYFVGNMRHFRIYNRVLTQDEITALFNSDGDTNGPNDLQQIVLPESNYFNNIPLEDFYLNFHVESIGEQSYEITMVDGKKVSPINSILTGKSDRAVDNEFYDTRNMKNIRPFGYLKTTPDGSKYPLPVALPEELIVLVNENKTYAENYEANKKDIEEREDRIRKFINNFMNVREKYEKRVAQIQETFAELKQTFVDSLDREVTNRIQEVQSIYDDLRNKAYENNLINLVNNFNALGKPVDEYINYLKDNGYDYDVINQKPLLLDETKEKLDKEVREYIKTVYNNNYTIDHDTVSMDYNKQDFLSIFNKVKSIITDNYYEFDEKFFTEGYGTHDNDLDFGIYLSYKNIQDIYRECGINSYEIQYLKNHGYSFSESKGEFVKDPNFVEPTDESKITKSDYYKLIPYVDYCIKEEDGHPPCLKFYRDLPNSASVRIIKIEPKSWFFFDAFFKVLPQDGMVILDKYTDFPVSKEYLDCTINNQNVEKSLITDVSDKAIHINAFDSLNLAYFRFAVPKHIDTWDYFKKYETYKTDLEKYLDAVGFYFDPANVDETYEINNLKGIEFRIHPSISPSIYDYPTRNQIYQEDMIYGNVKGPAFRVVRYCEDEMCKYNNFQGNDYIGRHLEHGEDWVYNAHEDSAIIKEYEKFYRLKDNTHRVPASEFRIVFEEGMLEYNSLFGTIMRTTEPDGSYLTLSEHPSTEKGYDVRGNLLYIDNDGNFVFSKTNLNEKEKVLSNEEYDANDILEESERPYIIASSNVDDFQPELEVVDPPKPEVDYTTGGYKVRFINGGFEPITLYDYANEVKSFIRYVYDDCIREDSTQVNGYKLRPFSWKLHGSTYTVTDEKKFGERSLLFGGSYVENGKTIDSYISTDLNNLAIEQDLDEYKNGRFTKNNNACIAMSMWIKPNKYCDCNSDGCNTTIEKCKCPGCNHIQGLVCDENGNFVLYIDADGHLSLKCAITDDFNIGESLTFLTEKYTYLYDGDWHHVMFQIKNFGNSGKRVIIGVDGVAVSSVVNLSDRTQFISFGQSNYLCIGKGFTSMINNMEVTGKSYRGYLDSFSIIKVSDEVEQDTDLLNTEVTIESNVSATIYDVPTNEEDFSFAEEKDDTIRTQKIINKKKPYYCILSFSDSEWTDSENNVVYDPTLDNKMDNYGQIISREIRVIGNEIYHEGDNPLKVPAMYFHTVESNIL